MKKNKKLSAKATAALLVAKGKFLPFPVVRVERNVLLSATGRKNLSAKFIIALDDAMLELGFVCGWRTKRDHIIDEWRSSDFNVAVMYYSKHEEYVQQAILMEDWKDNDLQQQCTQQYGDGLLRKVPLDTCPLPTETRDPDIHHPDVDKVQLITTPVTR